MKRRTLVAVSRLSGILALTLAIGCPERRAAWLLEGSTASRIRIGFGHSRGSREAIDFGSLVVYSCNDSGPSPARMLWAIHGSGESTKLDSVVINVPPNGFVVAKSVSLPKTGCISVESGAARLSLQLGEDGTVTELRRPR